MNARHIEERREMFMGEELVYFVAVLDAPLPAPANLNPYGEQGRCYAKLETSSRPVVVAPVVAKRVPSKVEYIRGFPLAGALPKCVVETIYRIRAFVRKTRLRFGIGRQSMPRRLRKAIARLDLSDLATYYDAGAIARVAHYHRGHEARLARTGTYIVSLTYA